MAPIYKSPTGETLDIPTRGIHSMEALGWVPANTTEAKAATAEAEAESINSETDDEDNTETNGNEGTTRHKSEELPAGNASHDTWHAYALADGMAEDELEDLNRNQIRDLFIE